MPEKQIYLYICLFLNSNDARVHTISQNSSMNWMLYRAINSNKGSPFYLKCIYYIILYYTTLYFIILYYIILYYIILYLAYKIGFEALTKLLILRKQNTFTNEGKFSYPHGYIYRYQSLRFLCIYVHIRFWIGVSELRAYIVDLN